MFDLEDDLLTDSCRIPWLFWIQILIFFLLIFLLCCFSLFSSDLFDLNALSSSPSSSVDGLSIYPTFSNKGVFKRNSPSILQRRNQVRGSQSIKGEVEARTSGRIVIGEEETESEEFSRKGVVDFHPCNYFRIAKLAFLKCFGLDPNSDSSNE